VLKRATKNRPDFLILKGVKKARDEKMVRSLGITSHFESDVLIEGLNRFRSLHGMNRADNVSRDGFFDLRQSNLRNRSLQRSLSESPCHQPASNSDPTHAGGGFLGKMPSVDPLGL
jgi:hypothetical protein